MKPGLSWMLLIKKLLTIADALTSQGMEDINVPHIYDFLTRYAYADDSPKLTTFFCANPGYRGFRCPFKEIPDRNGWEPDFSNRYFTEDIPLGLCIYKVWLTSSMSTPRLSTL